ncbi:MAG TPA: NAD(P)H-dependent oxidoreductase [Elusimicrobiota bacterium]|nr:NAD(P)H-dependent oxidoreductase [Elusimicrobiota bacterium]
MKKILFVEASPMEKSASRAIAQVVEEQLKTYAADAEIVHRDLDASPVPHLNFETIGAQRAGGEAAKLSDELVDEVLAADLIVIATPMWNFGVPSVLKAWVDHVARAGKTFSYSEKGPVGLVTGKQAIVIVSSGGVYENGPMSAMDFVTPYLKGVLGFLGIRDVETVRVGATAIPSLAAEAFEKARRQAIAAVGEKILTAK